MRFAARFAGVFLLTACLVGCDKAQVAQLESQIATISIAVVGTDAELLNDWDVIEEQPGEQILGAVVINGVFAARTTAWWDN